jgi:hypothetical protein
MVGINIRENNIVTPSPSPGAPCMQSVIAFSHPALVLCCNVTKIAPIVTSVSKALSPLSADCFGLLTELRRVRKLEARQRNGGWLAEFQKKAMGRSSKSGLFYVQTVECGTGQEANEEVHGEGD